MIKYLKLLGNRCPKLGYKNLKSPFKYVQKRWNELFNKIKEIINVFKNLVKRFVQGIKKNCFTILTWLTFILAILALLPYALEIYYNIHYRPVLTIDFYPLNISQDKNSDWLADYNLFISGNQYLVLPTKIYLSYDDSLIVPNDHPNMPGGLIGSLPVLNAKSLALIWNPSNSVIHSNRAIGLLTRARMKEKKVVLPIQLVIYAEIDPYDLGFWRLFYHSRLYKGVVSYNLEFIEGKRQEVIITLK